MTNGVIFEDNLEQRFPSIAINALWLVSFMRILLWGVDWVHLETAHEGIVIRMSPYQHNKRNGLVLMNYEAAGVGIKNLSPMRWQLKSKITHRRLDECDVTSSSWQFNLVLEKRCHHEKPGKCWNPELYNRESQSPPPLDPSSSSFPFDRVLNSANIHYCNQLWRTCEIMRQGRQIFYCFNAWFVLITNIKADN